MENAKPGDNASTGELRVTQLTAINPANVLTVICLGTLGLAFGVSNLRQVIYLCLHISYCLWWFLEQWFYPQRRQQLFSELISFSGFSFSLLFIGIFYALPGYLAFTNPLPLSLVATAAALTLYIFGSLVNASADVQKTTAKQQGAGLVSDGIWRFSRNINYFGDLLRYLSFSVIAGSAWAYLVTGAIVLLYLQRINQKEQVMVTKYADFPAYQRASARLIPYLW